MTKVYLQAMKWAERIIDREILTILRSVDRPLNPSEIAKVGVLKYLGRYLRDVRWEKRYADIDVA